MAHRSNDGHRGIPRYRCGMGQSASTLAASVDTPKTYSGRFIESVCVRSDRKQPLPRPGKDASASPCASVSSRAFLEEITPTLHSRPTLLAVHVSARAVAEIREEIWRRSSVTGEYCRRPRRPIWAAAVQLGLPGGGLSRAPRLPRRTSTTGCRCSTDTSRRPEHSSLESEARPFGASVTGTSARRAHADARGDPSETDMSVLLSDRRRSRTNSHNGSSSPQCVQTFSSLTSRLSPPDGAGFRSLQGWFSSAPPLLRHHGS